MSPPRTTTAYNTTRNPLLTPTPTVQRPETSIKSPLLDTTRSVKGWVQRRVCHKISKPRDYLQRHARKHDQNSRVFEQNKPLAGLAIKTTKAGDAHQINTTHSVKGCGRGASAKRR